MSDAAGLGPAGSPAVAEPVRPSLSVQAFWLMVARTIGFVVSTALPLLLVRVFSKSEFGIYKQAFTIIGTAQSLLPFSVGIGAFYFLARHPEKSREVIFNIFLYLSLVGGAAMLVLIAWPGLLRLIFGDDTLTRFSFVIGAIIFTWLVSSLLELAATAAADVAYSTVFIVTAQLTKTLLLIAGAAAFRTVEAVLYAALVQGILQCVALFWYLQKRFPGYWRRFDGQMAAEQFRYAIPLGLSGFLYGFQVDLHNYMVAHRFSAADYAIYTVGTTPVPLVGILRDSVNTVMLPRISKLQQEGDKEEILRLMFRSWHKLSAILLPTVAVLTVLGQEFIEVLYRKTYLSSYPIFVLNLSLLIIAVFVTDAVVRAHTELRYWIIKTRVISVIAQVIISLLAMRAFGMIGALMGVIGASAIERAVNFPILLRLLGFNRRHWAALSAIGGFAVASVVAALVTLAVRLLLYSYPPAVRLVVGGGVFGLVYAAVVVAMRLLDSEERALVNRYTSKFLGFAALR